MNYRQRRTLAGISLYTMAKQLGIEEEKYKEVEKKKRPLEGKLVDKFQEVIKNAKQIKFDRNIRLMEIDRWYASGEVKEALTEYGYNQVSLAKEMKLSNTTVLDAIKHGKATNDVKEKIYDFLNNPMNKKIKEEEQKETQIKDFGERLKALGLSQSEFSKIANCSQAVVSYLVTGTRKVSPKVVGEAGRILMQLEEQQKEEQKAFEPVEAPVVEEPVVEEPVEVVEEVEEAPVEEKTEVTDYKALYENLTERYALLLDESMRAKRQIMLYEKLIARL